MHFQIYFFQSAQTNRSGKFLFDEIFGIDVTGTATDPDEEKLRNCSCGRMINL